MTYKYDDPLKNGYIRLKVTKAQHKKIFSVRKIRPWYSHVYYYNGKIVIVEHLISRWYIALAIIPFLLVSPLMQGIPETWRELKRGLFQHKYGSFSSDSWKVIPGQNSQDEQPIVDEWVKSQRK